MEYPDIPVFWLDQGEVRERFWGYSHLHTDHYQSSEHAGVRKAKETSETDTVRKWDYDALTRSFHLGTLGPDSASGNYTAQDGSQSRRARLYPLVP